MGYELLDLELGELLLMLSLSLSCISLDVHFFCGGGCMLTWVVTYFFFIDPQDATIFLFFCWISLRYTWLQYLTFTILQCRWTVLERRLVYRESVQFS